MKRATAAQRDRCLRPLAEKANRWRFWQYSVSSLRRAALSRMKVEFDAGMKEFDACTHAYDRCELRRGLVADDYMRESERLEGREGPR